MVHHGVQRKFKKKTLFIFILVITLLSFSLVSSVSTTDLVSYYKLDEQDTTGSGTILDSLYNYNGTNIGSDNSSGILGTGYNFVRANDDRITLDNLLIGNKTNFTINLWAKTTDASNNLYLFSNGYSGDPRPYMGIVSRTSSVTFDIRNLAGSLTTITYGSNIHDGNWHMITFTKEGNNMNAFIDGSHVGSGTFAGGSMPLNTYSCIGSLCQVGTNVEFIGNIDEVLISEKNFTTEIEDLWNSGSGLAYDDFDSGESSPLLELTANSTSPSTVYTNTDYSVNLKAISSESYINSWTKFYVDGSLTGGIHYYNLTNNTNEEVSTLLSGNFSKDEVIIANVIIGNSTTNLTAVNLTSSTVQNSAPTTPTDLSFSSPVEVGENITATASGSTDADTDSITYYYEFYNTDDTTTVQSYSTQNYYTTQSSDAGDTIEIKTKASDSTVNSSEYSETAQVTEQKSISIESIYPIGDINVTQNEFFNVTLNVTCLSGECGTMNVTLDPEYSSVDNWFGFESTLLETGWGTGCSGASCGWELNSTYYTNGTKSAGTYGVGDSEYAWLNYTLDFKNAGWVQWDWKASTENGYDQLCYCVDKNCGDTGCACIDQAGSADLKISAEDWSREYNYIESGEHTLTWCYSKDGSYSSGLDTAFIDNVRIGYNNKSYYFQESPNSTSYDGYWNDSYPYTNIFDGDYDTYGHGLNFTISNLYLNYTKPENLTNAFFQIKNKYGDRYRTTPILENKSMPNSCIENTEDDIMIRLSSSTPDVDDEGYYGNMDCYNGTEWLTIFNGNNVHFPFGGLYYEEGIWFSTNSELTSKSNIIPTESDWTSTDAFYVNSSTNPVTTSSLSEGESETITFWVNATGDLDTYEFFAYANLTLDLSISNETNHWNVTIQEATAEDTCTYSSGNWEINLTDYCVISDNTDLGTNNITFVGTGNVTFNATISALNIGGLPANQRGYLGSNAVVNLG